MHTATAQRMISVDLASAWRLLTVGEHLAQWFAASGDVHPGGEVRFSFGDGDFFSGVVKRWAPPGELEWSWRFLGVGPTFDIRFDLTAVDGGTLVTVTDAGAVSAAEADSLAEGWRDFLERLEGYAATGRRTRFLWSETFAAAAMLPRDAGSPRDLLSSEWIGDRFRDAEVGVREVNGEISITFRDRCWDGVTTTARVRATAVADRVHLAVTHSGWPALAPDRRLAERRRYAELWQHALAQLEAAYPAPG